MEGGNWTLERKLAGMGGHYQVTNMIGNKLVSVFNYHPGGNADKFSESHLWFSDRNGKKVFKLPYKMYDNYEKLQKSKN